MNEDQSNDSALDQQDDSQLGDTQDQGDQASLQTDTGHDDSSAKNPKAPQKSHGKETVTPEEYKRLQGKVSKLEKDIAAQSKAPKKELSYDERVQADRMFNGNPALYETWRKKFVSEGGTDYGSYDKVYGGQGGATNSTRGEISPEDLTNKVDFIVDVKDFVRRYPEFNIDNIEDETEAEVVEEELDFVLRTAAQLQARARKAGKPLSKEDAQRKALVALDPDKYLNEERENGRIAGMQDAYSKGLGSGIGSGSAKGKARDIGLTDDDKAVAKMLRITEDKFLEQKKRSKPRKDDE
jgi:hypothetical protein